MLFFNVEHLDTMSYTREEGFTLHLDCKATIKGRFLGMGEVMAYLPDNVEFSCGHKCDREKCSVLKIEGVD